MKFSIKLSSLELIGSVSNAKVENLRYAGLQAAQCVTILELQEKDYFNIYLSSTKNVYLIDDGDVDLHGFELHEDGRLTTVEIEE